MARKEKHPPGDDAVGYGKPPVSTRFQKGNRANPNGRRGKKPKLAVGSIAAEAERIHQEVFTVTHNGRKRKLSGAQFVARRLFALVQAGDLKAIKLWADMFQPRLGPPENDNQGTTAVPEPEVDETDEAVIARYLTRAALASSPQNDDEEEPT